MRFKDIFCTCGKARLLYYSVCTIIYQYKWWYYRIFITNCHFKRKK